MAHNTNTVKGEEWYQAKSVAESYETKRFSRGGRLIDQREKQAVLEALGPVEGKRILDIAAGTGRFSLLLAELGADVTAVDISQAMLEQARDKRRGLVPTGTLSFFQGDASQLPFPDDAFDAVIAMRFFHLADDPVSFLDELARVADDTVIFDTFNRYSCRSIYNWALPMGSQLVSSREVTEWIGATDLELVDVTDDWLLPYGLYRIIPLQLARLLRPADARFVRVPGIRSLATVSYWTLRT